jgi:hypothetical protein
MNEEANRVSGWVVSGSNSRQPFNESSIQWSCLGTVVDIAILIFFSHIKVGPYINWEPGYRERLSASQQ